MKAFFIEYIYNVILAVVELAIGVLLFFCPVELGKFLVIAVGLGISVFGAFRIKEYFKGELIKGKHIRGLTVGSLLITLGACLMIQSRTIHSTLPDMVVLYGALMFAASILKVELAIGMIRLKYGNVLWMLIDAVFSLLVSLLMTINVYAPTGVPWVYAGASYIIAGVLDVTVMVIGEVKPKKQQSDKA